MTKSCKVSVIMPCFNHGEFLPGAVASVTGIGRDDVELIVVDDGSTDDLTRQELDKPVAQGIKVIRHENRGLPSLSLLERRARTGCLRLFRAYLKEEICRCG